MALYDLLEWTTLEVFEVVTKQHKGKFRVDSESAESEYLCFITFILRKQRVTRANWSTTSVRLVERPRIKVTHIPTPPTYVNQYVCPTLACPPAFGKATLCLCLHLYVQMPFLHFSGNSRDSWPKENRSGDSRFAERSAAAVSEDRGTCGIQQWDMSRDVKALLRLY